MCFGPCSAHHQRDVCRADKGSCERFIDGLYFDQVFREDFQVWAFGGPLPMAYPCSQVGLGFGSPECLKPGLFQPSGYGEM